MTHFKYAYIGVGTNLGNKLKNIDIALESITNYIGTIVKCSKLYKTPPWGFDSDQDFFNGIVKVETNLEPILLLKQLKLIEEIMGRDQGSKIGYQSRIIDLDIIDYNGQMFFSETLSIPHPLMTERSFVLYPLCDIDPNWKHPVNKVLVNQLIEELVPSSIEIVRNDL